MEKELKNSVWWQYLDEDIQELLEESMLLANNAGKWKVKFHDYAFVVFPAAKAYEGFLKRLFLDMNFISQEEYSGKSFRIGRALNPSLENYLRERESMYDRLVKYCGGHTLPDKLWETWKRCRNLTFHWFPNEKNAISLPEARDNFAMIVDAIEAACVACKMIQ